MACKVENAVTVGNHIQITDEIVNIIADDAIDMPNEESGRLWNIIKANFPLAFAAAIWDNT